MRLGREIDDAAYDMDLERQPLDGIAPARLELVQTARAPEPEVRVLERDIGLELGL